MQELKADKQQLMTLLQDLIRIESVNPSLVAGGTGESGVARHIGQCLASMGLEVCYQDVGAGRLNVVGRLKGSGQGPSLMLNGHMDTVSLAGMTIDPLEPVVRDGKVYGRGSVDMKGGLTAMIGAVDAIIRAGVRLPGDLIVAGVADEEYASLGTEVLVREYQADAGIVCERTDLKQCIAHKGFAWIKIDIFGRAAHGSSPKIGIDAIVQAGKLLVEIEKLGTRLAEHSHSLLGSPSIHASTIQGGQELSSYPAHCVLHLERRTIPGETAETVRREMEDIISSLSQQDPKFQAKAEVYFYRSPMELSPEHPIVQTLTSACQQVMGHVPAFVGASGWLDSAIMAEMGIPTVIFGPAGEGQHSAEEWVDFDSVVTAAEVLAETIVRFYNLEK